MIEWFSWVSDPSAWVSLLTLTILEIVLGVDNIIFISILAGKLPPNQQPKARNLGLTLALVTRILLLSMIFLLTKLVVPLFHILGHGFTGKDLVMLLGGLFLIWKSVKEIHHAMEGSHQEKSGKVAPTLASVIGTIIFVDVLFSLDSVITAVGLVGNTVAAQKTPAQDAVAALGVALQAGGMSPAVSEAFARVQEAVAPAKSAAGHGSGSMVIMITAIVISMGVMLAAAKSISDFVNRHPTVKMLALSFLILVGFVLVADGLGTHVPKGYIYFAMAFSFVVEMLNIRARRHAPTQPVELRKEY